ncbi:MAG: cellulase family glycosylhydrolase [Labilithrix sp.]|nr:cellulase family glycosylhydrolase [Labilithrix sp.]MCW5815582.1 cellulase family glycosylhydrolase [Labilithrix sp.]
MRVALAGLLLCACARVPPAPAVSATHVRAATLPAVTLDAHGFVRGGKRFVPLGAHWVPAKAAMGWPLHFDPADVEADFAKMRDLGFTVTRFDLLWAWFEPRPGVYNEAAFKQLDTLVALAGKYGVYLHPSLFIGGEVGEAYWDVPWRNGRHPHKDPEMIRLEANLAAELGRRYADETAILAWDLTDEPPFWIATDVNDAEAIAWTRAIAEGIRRHDKKHPIVVGAAGQETSHGPFRADNMVKVDAVGFLSVHPFTIYDPKLFPDAMLSERSTYGAAFQIALASGAGRPAMVHEMGASTAQYAPERIANYERASLYSALAAGSIGVDLWCYTDAAPEQWSQLPYLRTPQETEWGLATWDRKDKPRGREFRKLTQVVGRMDVTGVAAADAALVVPEEWAKPHGDFSRQRLTGKEPIPYVSTEDTVGTLEKAASGNEWLMGGLLNSFVLARRAGMKADMPREYDDAWTRRPIVLLPSPLTSTSTPFLTHVHTGFYARARRYVEAGGVLYASVAADAAVPDMEPLFGARLADTNTASSVTIRIVKAFGELAPGETYSFTVPVASSRYWGSVLEAGRGEVVAVDQDGRPAIVVNKLGRGTTVLAAFPFESWLATTPSAFDAKDFRAKPQLVDRLYRAVRALGPRPRFELAPAQPEVEATPLGDRYLVLVNHGPDPRRVEVRAAAALRSVERVTTTGKEAVSLANGRFAVDLPPWDGAVFEHR